MEYKSPVYNVIAVPIEKVKPNNYNPNKVAPTEMRLLYESIKEDGYTMPVVCYYSKAKDYYLIVDGFHPLLFWRRPDQRFRNHIDHRYFHFIVLCDLHYPDHSRQCIQEK